MASPLHPYPLDIFSFKHSSGDFLLQRLDRKTVSYNVVGHQTLMIILDVANLHLGQQHQVRDEALEEIRIHRRLFLELVAHLSGHQPAYFRRIFYLQIARVQDRIARLDRLFGMHLVINQILK